MEGYMIQISEKYISTHWFHCFGYSLCRKFFSTNQVNLHCSLVQRTSQLYMINSSVGLFCRTFLHPEWLLVISYTSLPEKRGGEWGKVCRSSNLGGSYGPWGQCLKLPIWIPVEIWFWDGNWLNSTITISSFIYLFNLILFFLPSWNLLRALNLS